MVMYLAFEYFAYLYIIHHHEAMYVLKTYNKQIAIVSHVLK